jgi:hypothetical protein
MIAEEKDSRMDGKTKREVRRILIMLLIPVLVVAAFLAAAPWLRETIGAPMLALLSIPLGLVLLVGAEYLAIQHNRGLDEVQRASQGFAVRWGAAGGQLAFCVLLLLPPFQGWAAGVVTQLAGEAGMNVDGSVVTLAIVFGFGCLMLLQAVATFVLGFIWWKRSQ